MKRLMIIFTAMAMSVMPAGSLLENAGAQTRNQSSKVQFTEAFIFPNDCTNELMDVTDKTTITCHDQQTAGGTFNEKCEIRQDITAVGQTTGITWQGTATFKDDLVTTDNCNFSFSNRGKVHLISRGSAVNTIVTFDDFVRIQDCVMTADQHVVSFDCRGAGNQ